MTAFKFWPHYEPRYHKTPLGKCENESMNLKKTNTLFYLAWSLSVSNGTSYLFSSFWDGTKLVLTGRPFSPKPCSFKGCMAGHFNIKSLSFDYLYLHFRYLKLDLWLDLTTFWLPLKCLHTLWTQIQDLLHFDESKFLQDISNDISRFVNLSVKSVITIQYNISIMMSQNYIFRCLDFLHNVRKCPAAWNMQRTQTSSNWRLQKSAKNFLFILCQHTNCT